MRKYFNLISCFILLFIVQKSYAQDGAGVYPILDIRPFMKLELLNISSANIDFNFEEENEMINGKQLQGMIKVKIKSNQNWQLSVVPSKNVITEQSNVLRTLPVSIISIKKLGPGSYIPLTPEGISIASGLRGNSLLPSNNITLDIMAKPGVNAESGVYLVNLIYTLSAN